MWVALNYSAQTSRFVSGLEEDGAIVLDVPFDNSSTKECSALIDGYIQDIGPDVIDCEVAARTVRHAIISSNRFTGSKAKKIFKIGRAHV